MAKQILDYSAARGTGLTGTNALTFTAFDFSTYGFTNLVKFMIEFDAVAVATTEGTTTGAYSNAYSARVTYNYDPSTDVAVIVATHVLVNDASDVTWNVFSSSGACQLRGQVVATTKTWNIGFFARMIATCEN